MSYAPATMNLSAQQERSVANQVLAKHWLPRTLPVDPFVIANELGFVIKTSFNGSGLYKPDEGAIYYNPSEPYVRQRFTVAHELGHHLFGHGERPRDNAGAFNMFNFDPVEAQANRFAAELLMPAASVEYFVRTLGVTSISRMASEFDVSEVAMRNRLKNMGYLS